MSKKIDEHTAPVIAPEVTNQVPVQATAEKQLPTAEQLIAQLSGQVGPDGLKPPTAQELESAKGMAASIEGYAKSKTIVRQSKLTPETLQKGTSSIVARCNGDTNKAKAIIEGAVDGHLAGHTSKDAYGVRQLHLVKAAANHIGEQERLGNVGTKADAGAFMDKVSSFVGKCRFGMEAITAHQTAECALVVGEMGGQVIANATAKAKAAVAAEQTPVAKAA